jgi:hypothetical protein
MPVRFSAKTPQLNVYGMLRGREKFPRCFHMCQNMNLTNMSLGSILDGIDNGNLVDRRPT